MTVATHYTPRGKWEIYKASSVGYWLTNPEGYRVGHYGTPFKTIEDAEAVVDVWR